MNADYWLRQTAAQPLFPELEWSRPENRLQAGKLLIVGGNRHGFAAPAEAYAAAGKAGVGTARVLLPDATKKLVGPLAQYVEFAPSTPSGSFSRKALDELLSLSTWADATLLAGDLGRNSETAILLENFLAKNEQSITLTKDSVDYAVALPQLVLTRPNTTLVLSLAQLQQLGKQARVTQAARFGMNLLQLVDWLHDFTTQFAPHIVVKHLDTLFVAVDGQVSTTKLNPDPPIWRVKTAAHASVWWLQNPTKPFEALTIAARQAWI